MSSLVAIKRRAEGAAYEDEVFENLDLRSMLAFGAKFVRCTFRDCLLDLSDIRNAKLEGCVFENCSLTRVNFSASFLDATRFFECDLEQASFSGCHLDAVAFIECRMAYGETLFQGATVRRSVSFDRCNMHGSNLDFRQAAPGELKFNDSNLWGAKLSMGCAVFNAQMDERTCQRFVAMIARIYPGDENRSKLVEVAGDQMAVVERAMREAKP